MCLLSTKTDKVLRERCAVNKNDMGEFLEFPDILQEVKGTLVSIILNQFKFLSLFELVQKCFRGSPFRGGR